MTALLGLNMTEQLWAHGGRCNRARNNKLFNEARHFARGEKLSRSRYQQRS